MNIVGNNMQEVQDYVVETNHLGHIITFFMNYDLYQSLPDNVRTLVIDIRIVRTTATASRTRALRIDIRIDLY